ncbi:unnamed protein product [Arabis nemorensis]|uniref:Uncharacterized protein n=1 Tax=Arabis nemorensis TaxID=586526 RepID=A0A565BFH6_9BRAS|nr:unnamed protein product [Arabis nemorensis]
MHPIDPLERTLVNSVTETGQLDDAAAGYAKLMDASKRVLKLVAIAEMVEVSEKDTKVSD